MKIQDIITSFDLEQMGLLPSDWLSQVDAAATASARVVEMSGSSSTSREAPLTRVEYSVVTGEDIVSRLPWLWSLYTSEFLRLASKVAGRPMKVSQYVKSAINMNVLDGTNARYEWHVDSNPLTGLLYANTLRAEDGGELVFRIGGETLPVLPTQGQLIFFDARELPHTVMPLKTNICRISIPMNFFYLDEPEIRPDDLDRHIYGAEASS